MKLILVALPGGADVVLAESSFRDDEPALWARYQDNRAARRNGRGWRVTVTLSAADWLRIGRYLESKAGALDAAIRDVADPSDRAELRAVRTALSRITGALVGY